MEKSDKKDKILLVRHLGRITSWLKSYVDSFFGNATEVTAALQVTDNAVKAAEAQRVTAETQRVGEEKQRISDEQNRVAAETARVNAEKTRMANETARVSAETDRDAAEKERARVFATYEATINDLQTRLTVLESKRSILLEE